MIHGPEGYEARSPVEMAIPQRPRVPVILWGLACVAVGVVGDAAFLPHQSLWLDEVVQMSGLTLGPWRVVGFLAGRENPFPLPSDRMPALSYWVGQLWGSLFGLEEHSMRWLGVVAVALATALVFAAAQRAWGLLAGVVAGLLIATSPNIVTLAVEIRTYPLFLLAAAGAFYSLVRYLEPDAPRRSRWLAAMTACGVVSINLHYFGLILCGSLFAVLLLRASLRREGVRPLIAAGAVIAASAIGIAPFVLAATRASKPDATLAKAEPPSTQVRKIVRLAYHMASHGMIAVSRAALAAALLGCLVAIVAGPFRVIQSDPVVQVLAGALVVGFCTVSAAQFITVSFEPTKVSYSTWMFSGMMLLLSSGGSASHPRGVRLVWAAGVAMLLSANVYALSLIPRYGDYFAHSPSRRLHLLVRELGADRVAVIHDESEELAFPYYTLVYSFGRPFDQYKNVGGRSLVYRIADPASPAPPDPVDPATLARPYLIVVRAVSQTSEEIGDQIRCEVVGLDPGPVARALDGDRNWEKREHFVWVSFVKYDVRVYRRKQPAPD
jgi:hypothetical protein